MNILFLGNFQGRGWDGSITDENHIADALEELGHGVTRAQRQESLEFKSDIWDMTLISQWDGYKELINLPHPIVYWAFDYQADGQEWHQRLIANADLYLSKRIADSKYSNWQWFNQDFSPEFLHAWKEPVEKDIEVLFTGSYLPWATERNKTIAAVDKEFDLTIHSVNEWPGIINDPPVMDEDLIKLIPRAKICLAIDHTLEAGYWSDRAAQYICCGGFVLHRYVPMLETRFHHNIMYFHNVEDCLEQIAWWLDHDEDREVVAAEAYENCTYYKVQVKAAELMEVVEQVL